MFLELMAGPVDATHMKTTAEKLQDLFKDFPQQLQDIKYSQICFLNNNGAEKVLRFITGTNKYRDIDFVRARRWVYGILGYLTYNGSSIHDIRDSLISKNVCLEIARDMKCGWKCVSDNKVTSHFTQMYKKIITTIPHATVAFLTNKILTKTR